jgi:hypothetical protein
MKDILERLAHSSPNEGSHDLYCRCLDAAEEVSRLRSLIAHLAAPVGFRLVPVRPTPEMLDAGCEVDLEEETPEHYLAYIKDIYTRMVKAVPNAEYTPK